MRTLWMASAVFLLGALACALQRRDDAALILAAIGFQLVFVADSDIDWALRLTRGNWRSSLVERRWRTTVLGKLAQALSTVCLLSYFAVVLR